MGDGKNGGCRIVKYILYIAVCLYIAVACTFAYRCYYNIGPIQLRLKEAEHRIEALEDKIQQQNAIIEKQQTTVEVLTAILKGIKKE